MILSINANQVRQVPVPETVSAACQGMDSDLFFPDKASPADSAPNEGERKALRVCAPCQLKRWCLAQELAEVSVEERIRGVRGGLRQVERRALYRARNEAGRADR
ncbi:WhiB family transcriptional regulator [Streptomyces sp. NPDC001250]|uniref:WhiB family transcriptional regulator n=1 Tax=Streptomyces TaxID=1883 RepID=UPI003320828B